MILAKGRREQTIWFSLSEDINADLRAYDPSIPNISSVLGMLKVIYDYSLCVLSLSPSFFPFTGCLLLHIPFIHISSDKPLAFAHPLSFFSPLITKTQCILLYYTGLLPFVRLDSDIIGIPIDNVDYSRVREQKALKALPDAVCWVLAFVLGGKPPSALIPRGLFKHLRARGVPIFFLGVNDEEDLKVRKRGGCLGGLGMYVYSPPHIHRIAMSFEGDSSCFPFNSCFPLTLSPIYSFLPPLTGG